MKNNGAGGTFPSVKRVRFIDHRDSCEKVFATDTKSHDASNMTVCQA